MAKRKVRSQSSEMEKKNQELVLKEQEDEEGTRIRIMGSGRNAIRNW